MLKEMLDKDKECVSYLDELKKKGVTYDKLWYEKLYSETSIFTSLLFIINTLINIFTNNFITFGFFTASRSKSHEEGLLYTSC